MIAKGAFFAVIIVMFFALLLGCSQAVNSNKGLNHVESAHSVGTRLVNVGGTGIPVTGGHLRHVSKSDRGSSYFVELCGYNSGTCVLNEVSSEGLLLSAEVKDRPKTDFSDLKAPYKVICAEAEGYEVVAQAMVDKSNQRQVAVYIRKKSTDQKLILVDEEGGSADSALNMNDDLESISIVYASESKVLLHIGSPVGKLALCNFDEQSVNPVELDTMVYSALVIDSRVYLGLYKLDETNGDGPIWDAFIDDIPLSEILD
ncbi:MAG: hypothetical protein KDC26_07655 [Armatimonadetes bacterium]|nr:hypothetical protein [Armatimonadota bacterium]